MDKCSAESDGACVFDLEVEAGRGGEDTVV